MNKKKEKKNKETISKEDLELLESSKDKSKRKKYFVIGFIVFLLFLLFGIYAYTVDLFNYTDDILSVSSRSLIEVKDTEFNMTFYLDDQFVHP